MKKLLLLSFVFTAFSGQAQFWTQKATGFTAASRGINAISIADANNIWAKAYDGSSTATPNVREFTRSTDGGNTWTTGVINPALIGANTAIGSITAVSGTTAWVSANPSSAGGNNNGIYKTIDGGVSWTRQGTAAFTSSSFANIVHFWNTNNGVAMGDPTDGYFEIYTTSNGGTTWTRVSQSSIPAQAGGEEYGYTNGYTVSGNTIWFGTSAGRLFRSSDMGLTWSAFQAPLADFGGTDASGITGSYSFSNNLKGLLILSNGNLYNTTNGGETWTPQTYTGIAFVNDIAYIPGSTKVVTTAVDPDSVSGAGSSYSLNDGATWTNATIDVGMSQLNTVRFLNESVGFAGGFTASSTVGGIFKYTGTELPVAQFNRARFSASPNPTNGLLQLVDENSPMVDVVVFDLLGKQVYNNKFNALSEVNLDLTALQSGAYVLKATNNAGATSTLKIMKN